ncbi:uncharacterized protein LOC130442346 [Diorhabda sublineata]|uniref:uncharacterized protein LOC130442346 n=1 Tax=Diorhabda sublineata TaxID=1163346 RepID=UPI0024E083DA|nr:uncharacterized protein LOC130442346 [Diorhabda sublineata]
MMSLLSVTVKKARFVGIQAQQFNTYVTLKLQNVKSTTVTVKGATPCWEQDFLFETNNLDTGLLIEVWSKGMIWDRAIGYHWIPLQTIQYSNEEGNGQWRSLEAELVMRDGEVIGTKMPTGHSLLLDCRFELPFDAENIEAMDLQRKLEMLNNSMSMDQEGRLDNFRRQMIYLGHSHDNQFENDISAGYSEDSDYTSDLNYPVGQHPNSSASQFRSAAYQINTPQRSLETSRENSSERADTPNAYNHQQMLGVSQNQQHLSPDVHRRHYQHPSSTDNCATYKNNQRSQNSNQLQESSTDTEPLFYNSRPHNQKLSQSNYSSRENWMSCESMSYNQSNDSFDATYYADANETLMTQYSKGRRPSLERQTTLYDDASYDYAGYSTSTVSRYSSFQQNKSVEEYYDSLPYPTQDERFGQEDEDRQWDSGGYNMYVLPKPRTSKKLPTIPAQLQNITNKQLPSIQNLQNTDTYSLYDESSRPMSTGRRKMPQIPTKINSWRQFSQQSQEEGCKSPESYTHRGASLPPTPTKNSRIMARLTQALEPTRAMTPGRKLPTPNLKGKRNKQLKRTSSADDYGESQIDNTYVRFGAISATENYNEDYNYAYQSTDNLPVAQDIDVYTLPYVANDKSVAYPQVPTSTTFQNDFYYTTAQNCDYNQTYYNDDVYRKQGLSDMNTNHLIQQNTDSLESRDDELKDSFDTVVSSKKSLYVGSVVDTVLTNTTHNLDIAQKNILNSIPILGDHQQQQQQTPFRAIENTTALPSITVAAQVHNHSSMGNNSVNGKTILKQPNCVDTNYYGSNQMNQLNQLENDKELQDDSYLETEEPIEEYIEEETEGSISYGQNAVNQAIKLDSPLSVIHVENREENDSSETHIMRSREPSQASVIMDPYHPAALAAMQRAQQAGTGSRRSSAEQSYQTYDDPYLNYQRKNGTEPSIPSRRLSVRRSPTAQEQLEDVLDEEHLQDVQKEITEETSLVVPEIHEEELKEQRPQITAQQRWLWAYNKIIMQLDVSTIIKILIFENIFNERIKFYTKYFREISLLLKIYIL